MSTLLRQNFGIRTRYFSIFLLLAAIIIGAVFVLPHTGTTVAETTKPRATQWEYAALMSISGYTRADGRKDPVNTSDFYLSLPSGSFSAKTIAELAKDASLELPKSDTSELALLNALGLQGWELVTHSENTRSIIDFGATNVVTFSFTCWDQVRMVWTLKRQH